MPKDFSDTQKTLLSCTVSKSRAKFDIENWISGHSGLEFVGKLIMFEHKFWVCRVIEHNR